MNDLKFNQEVLSDLDEILYINDDRTKKELAFLQTVIPLNNFPSILDLGCGRGRMAIGLAQMGYSVFGIDESENRLSQLCKDAKQYGLANIRTLECNFFSDTLSSIDEKFNATILIYGVLSCLDSERIRQFFSSMFNKLSPNGVFLIDLLNKPYAIQKSSKIPVCLTERVRCLRSEIAALMRWRYVTEDGNQEKNVYEMTTKNQQRLMLEYNHPIHDFSAIVNLLKVTGFVSIEKFGSYDVNNAYSADSPRMIIVAKK